MCRRHSLAELTKPSLPSPAEHETITSRQQTSICSHHFTNGLPFVLRVHGMALQTELLVDFVAFSHALTFAFIAWLALVPTLAALSSLFRRSSLLPSWQGLLLAIAAASALVSYLRSVNGPGHVLDLSLQTQRFSDDCDLLRMSGSAIAAWDPNFLHIAEDHVRRIHSFAIAQESLAIAMRAEWKSARIHNLASSSLGHAVTDCVLAEKDANLTAAAVAMKLDTYPFKVSFSSTLPCTLHPLTDCLPDINSFCLGRRCSSCVLANGLARYWHRVHRNPRRGRSACGERKNIATGIAASGRPLVMLSYIPALCLSPNSVS